MVHTFARNAALALKGGTSHEGHRLPADHPTRAHTETFLLVLRSQGQELET